MIGIFFALHFNKKFIMAYTVNSSFEDFMRDSVNLDPERTATARSSRDWLVQKIEDLANRGKIPPLYKGTDHIFFGSFARSTKIRPLDDIDIMIMFDAQGCTTDDLSKTVGKAYPLYVNNLHVKLLSEYCDGNIINSRKMIEAIKKELGAIPSYSKAEIHRNQEAVTLQLSSYEWNFDIVPCFYTATGFYVIPDGKGNWKGTDPRIDQNRVTQANQRCNGALLPAIRLMKYWKKEHWGDEVSSYLFENWMIDWANNLIVFPSSYPLLVKSALDALSSNIMMDYHDPKGFQGNLNNLDIYDRSRLSAIASNNLLEVNTAIQYEQKFMIEAAINKWIRIFGNKFPEYGK